MFSKIPVLCVLGMLAAMLSSCVAPFVPYEDQEPLAAQDPGVSDAPAVNSAEQKNIKETQKKVSQGESGGTGDSTASTSEASAPPTSANASNDGSSAPKPTYRYALQIPGKEGFVFNPFTNNPVDVRGIPSGTLVRDPQDSNPDHKFRVP